MVLRRTALPALLVLHLLTTLVVGGEDPPRRAKPPRWSKDVLDTFFEDVRAHLVGQRPEATTSLDRGSDPQQADDDTGEAFAWSRLIEADTLVSEIKQINNSLARAVATPGPFKSGGNKLCRREFSMLAVMFGVIAQYDQQIRWQQQAVPMRDALARAAKNCKTATDQSFTEVKRRRQELDDLVRGQPLQLAAPAEEEFRWSDVADQSQLMQRMEISLQERIEPLLSDGATLRRNSQKISHEAQLLAMLAEVIQREGYEFSDDDSYLEYSQELGDAAAELSRAAVELDYQRARQAAARATEACTACHEGYRG